MKSMVSEGKRKGSSKTTSPPRMISLQLLGAKSRARAKAREKEKGRARAMTTMRRTTVTAGKERARESPQRKARARREMTRVREGRREMIKEKEKAKTRARPARAGTITRTTTATEDAKAKASHMTHMTPMMITATVARARERAKAQAKAPRVTEVAVAATMTGDTTTNMRTGATVRRARAARERAEIGGEHRAPYPSAAHLSWDLSPAVRMKAFSESGLAVFVMALGPTRVPQPNLPGFASDFRATLRPCRGLDLTRPEQTGQLFKLMSCPFARQLVLANA
mmetsp:Transcript_241/g.447  ORF Transcript_241/g.447 Transcript_241/m.447 type:complete len:282 (-) Transcript_241:90-935(-)